MEMMVYNYGKTKSKEDKTKMLHKGAYQILMGFIPLSGSPPPPYHLKMENLFAKKILAELGGIPLPLTESRLQFFAIKWS